MSKQLHKNFTDYQVKSFLKGYLDKKIKIEKGLIKKKEGSANNVKRMYPLHALHNNSVRRRI